MQREIRFRAWDAKRSEMFIPYELTFTKRGLHARGGQYAGTKEDFILMQFTGLKDKNGKEIYEGDLLREKNDPDVARVIYQDGAYWFCYDKKNLFTYDWAKDNDAWGNLIVVGNIYENPELLK